MCINDSTKNYTFPTAVLITSMSSCILSVLGSFVIFGTYIFIPDIRNSTRRLVTCLTVADFLTALGYLISAFAHFAGTQKDVCTAQSVMTTYSSLVSFYLTVAIAVHIFVTVLYRDDSTSTWKFLLVANIVSWIIPGIIISVAGAYEVLGRDNVTESVGTGPWCWLKRHNTHYTVWMFLTGKGWEFLCYLLTTSLYILLKLYLYLRHRYTSFDAIHENLREDDQNYLYVWFLLYVLRLWGSIRSIMSLTGTDKHSPGDTVSKVFMYMQAVGDPGQAFCNCILFCFLDKTVRPYIFSICRKRTHIEEHEERRHLISNDHQHKYNEEHPSAEGDTAISENSGQYPDVSTHGYAYKTRSTNVSVQSNSS